MLNNDVFILPSWDEGQPISILEAYVTGCAVITDENIGGIGDIFQNEINGISCTARDVENIYLAIEKIKDDNKFIKDNYWYGIENFKKENFVRRIEKIILGENR
ncbi:glycosyltransferase [Fusobacterium sp. SB021]|uniref:glycosyltransferase n=1 Tax=Fusobacterium sp. SB021 TaxID=2744227 RepID=UPI003CF3FA3A